MSGDNLQGRLSFPTLMSFEPIQLCNAACFCCPYSWLKDDVDYKGKRMSRENISDLINQFGKPLLDNKVPYPSVLFPWRYSDPLVCPDLNFIFKESSQYPFKIDITTNAVSFHKKNIEILEKNIDKISDISISIIGSDQESVKKYMAVSLKKTLSRLEYLSLNNSPLIKKMMVRPKQVTNSKEEKVKIDILVKSIKKMGFKCSSKKDWQANRVETNKAWSDKTNKQKGFVVNCGLTAKKGLPHRILRRVEVAYDGDVLLCCDDATKQKVFGNVFKEGLINIWNGALLKEHQILFSSENILEKKSLICNNCSRAKLSWDTVTK